MAIDAIKMFRDYDLDLTEDQMATLILALASEPELLQALASEARKMRAWMRENE